MHATENAISEGTQRGGIVPYLAASLASSANAVAKRADEYETRSGRPSFVDLVFPEKQRLSSIGEHQARDIKHGALLLVRPDRLLKTNGDLNLGRSVTKPSAMFSTKTGRFSRITSRFSSLFILVLVASLSPLRRRPCAGGTDVGDLAFHHDSSLTCKSQEPMPRKAFSHPDHCL
jgi:hypothetical protein